MALLHWHRQASDILRTVSTNLELGCLLDQGPWTNQMVNDVDTQLQLVAQHQDDLAQQHGIDYTANFELQELLDQMEQPVIELPRCFDDLQQNYTEYLETKRHFRIAQEVFFQNNRLGNMDALHEISQQCRLGGAPTITEEQRPSITTSFINRHVDLFLKYSFTIATTFEAHNIHQRQITNPVQATVPKSWISQQLQQIEEYKNMGRRRKRSLVKAIFDSITEGGLLVRQQLAHLSDGSFAHLQQFVVDTQQQLESSARYLQNPDDNSHLLDNCFRPELDHIITKQHLYNIIPKPALKKKYIKLTNETMAQILRSIGLQQYIHGSNTLTHLFSISKIQKGSQLTFANNISTDGFVASVPFKKRINNNDNRLPNLDINDFAEWELQYMNVWGADPGMNCVYVASNGCDRNIYDYAVEHDGKFILLVCFYLQCLFTFVFIITIIRCNA
jgi:hypothetical protein